MRAPAPVVLLALLLAPACAAQGPEPALMTLALDSFGGAIMPLSGNGVANGTLEAPCVATPGGRSHRVAFQVLDAPSWASVVVQPTEASSPSGCQETWSTEVRLVATLTAQAPAYRPATLTLRATSVDGALGAPAEATVDLVPDYFGLLEVQVLEPIKEVKPRETATFPVKVTNLGNGRAEIRVQVLDAASPVSAQDAGPVILGSAQQGDDETSAVIPLRVHTRGGDSFYVNEAAVVTYAATERYVEAGLTGGGRTVVSVIVTQKGLDAPGPGAGPLLAVLAVAALALAGRRALR